MGEQEQRLAQIATLKGRYENEPFFSSLAAITKTCDKCGLKYIGVHAICPKRKNFYGITVKFGEEETE